MKSSLRLSRLVFLVALLLSLAAPVMAQKTMSAHAVAAQVHGPQDAAEMEAFMDGLLRKQLEGNHIAGAAVAVVKDGKLFFAKGYGYANVEKQIPVVAEQTVFKIGSVTKLFTWTPMSTHTLTFAFQIRIRNRSHSVI